MSKTIYGFEKRDKRRANPGERKAYQVGELWDRHHEILRLALIGLSNVRIAEMVGVTPVCVSQCLNSDLGKAKLSVMRGARDANTFDVAKKIEDMKEEAMNVYEDILRAEKDDKNVSMSLKKATADTIIKELGGHEAPKKVAIAGHFTIEDIEAIKERGRELAKESGNLIEVN